jgi:hypothetical protein
MIPLIYNIPTLSGSLVQDEVGWRDGHQLTSHSTDQKRHNEAERQRVKSQLNTFTPVGTAIIIVMMPKKPLTSAPAPMVKK